MKTFYMITGAALGILGYDYAIPIYFRAIRKLNDLEMVCVVMATMAIATLFVVAMMELISHAEMLYEKKKRRVTDIKIEGDFILDDMYFSTEMRLNDEN